MKRKMKKSPNLLAYRTETVMLDLIKVKDPDEILDDALVGYLNQV